MISMVSDQALNIAVLKEVNSNNGKPEALTPSGHFDFEVGAVFIAPGFPFS